MKCEWGEAKAGTKPDTSVVYIHRRVTHSSTDMKMKFSISACIAESFVEAPRVVEELLLLKTERECTVGS